MRGAAVVEMAKRQRLAILAGVLGCGVLITCGSSVQQGWWTRPRRWLRRRVGLWLRPVTG